MHYSARLLKSYSIFVWGTDWNVILMLKILFTTVALKSYSLHIQMSAMRHMKAILQHWCVTDLHANLNIHKWKLNQKVKTKKGLGLA